MLRFASSKILHHVLHRAAKDIRGPNGGTIGRRVRADAGKMLFRSKPAGGWAGIDVVKPALEDGSDEVGVWVAMRVMNALRFARGQ